MGQLIAIEGVDGAGKRTLTRALTRRSISQGLSVATLDFPRYGRSVHADLAAESLKGGHGDVVSSAYAMGLLFALDRRDARDELAGLTRSHDLVILDRWVASNAAYGAARLHQDGDGDMARWVHQLEYERFGLPHPDWQVFLDVSPSWPSSAPVSANSRRATALATPTNVTRIYSSGYRQRMPIWRSVTGAAPG